MDPPDSFTPLTEFLEAARPALASLRARQLAGVATEYNLDRTEDQIAKVLRISSDDSDRDPDQDRDRDYFRLVGRTHSDRSDSDGWEELETISDLEAASYAIPSVGAPQLLDVVGDMQRARGDTKRFDTSPPEYANGLRTQAWIDERNLRKLIERAYDQIDQRVDGELDPSIPWPDDPKDDFEPAWRRS